MKGKNIMMRLKIIVNWWTFKYGRSRDVVSLKKCGER